MNSCELNKVEVPSLHERTVPEITDVLQRTLGQKVVADYCGIESAKNVRLVAFGEKVPDQFCTEKLVDLAELTETLLQIDDASERELTRNKLIETIINSNKNS